MAHARQTIREAAATKVTGLTTTGANVFQSRMVPQTTALPCLLVTTNDEEINPGTIGDLIDRSLDLVITGVAKASGADDTLDTIAAEVETAMATFAYRNALTAINIDFDEALEKPAGRIALTFRVNYFTAAGTPGTPI